MTPSTAARPVRVLDLRSVRGTGGGPEKTILRGAAASPGRDVAVTVCYVRDQRDQIFAVDRRPEAARADYVEIVERHSFDIRVFALLRGLIRERGIDIVHGHDYKTDLLALALARAEAVRPIATAHGWTGDSTRERLVYYPADRWLLARFPMVIAVSSEIRTRLIRSGARPDRVRTVVNGIDPHAFSRLASREAEARASIGLRPGEVAIGAVGRLTSQKRFDLLLAAFALLAKERPDLVLAIAGDGPDRSALEALAVRLGIQSRCRFLGHCDDVIGIHHALTLFVQSSDYEGTPNVVLEAMALRTPVVATDAGGTSDIMADRVHGLVVPRGDPRALACAIRHALDHPAMTRERAAAARDHVEARLSFDNRVDRVDALYRELMDAAAA